MDKKTKYWITMGVAVAAIGVTAYVLMARKKANTAGFMYDGAGNVIAEGATAIQEQPNALRDGLTILLNKLLALPVGAKSTSDPAKVLKFGLENDRDVKILQMYLNTLTDYRKSKGMPYLAVLSLSGNFTAPTGGAMQVYLGKQTITAGELNSISGGLPADVIVG